MIWTSLLILCLTTASSFYFPVPLWFSMPIFSLTPILIGCLRSRKLSPYFAYEFTTDTQTLKPWDQTQASRYPLIATTVLLTIYMLIKLTGPKFVSSLLFTYYIILGVFCFKSFIEQLLQSKLKITLMKRLISRRCKFSWRDFFSYLLAVPFGILYYKTQNWLLSNLFGLALAVHTIENMSIGSFKISFGLLISLLVYDVVFVFGTDVMVTVANQIDAPFKLLIPNAGRFSMIGLGDIIIPGIFLALCIRYDLFRIFLKESQQYVFFGGGLAGYFVGILASVGAMQLTHQAQPALLYLVPCCLVSTILTALVVGEIKKIWLYKEN